MGVESRLPTQALVAWVGVSPYFLLCYLAGVERLLSKRFLSCKMLLSWSLARKNRLFRLICAHWHFWVAGVFIYSSGIMRQKQIPGKYHHIISGILSSLADMTSSLQLFELSCFICNVQNIQLYLVGRTGKSASILYS